jgi:hypothetical protein
VPGGELDLLARVGGLADGLRGDRPDAGNAPELGLAQAVEPRQIHARPELAQQGASDHARQVQPEKGLAGMKGGHSSPSGEKGEKVVAKNEREMKKL